ncbi:hypothetical protein [Marmoricola sp. URHB0036]|uniref:hypothetical protein n=1 Tax=Marmoricola sp. URHB0036 TaxID=1298863 RepID=UPI0004834378|nr:hypothetical protein [Marmoricola sp. URHB0036]
MSQRFIPSASKLEAVARISNLTRSGPETLGPGSKERKSVLVNLSRGLSLAVDESLSKPELGEAIAREIGATWDRSCWSAGSTITLVGLDRLLEAAERHGSIAAVGVSSHATYSSPRAEAEALMNVLVPLVRGEWDGRTCVNQMREAEFTHWAQDKWAGWYFEFIALPELINRLGGGPRKVVNTTFDYVLRSTWDLKAHSESGGAAEAILNDQEAVRRAIDEGGLGFIVLSGRRVDDGGEFRAWQRRQRLAAGKKPKPRRRAAGDETTEPRQAPSSPTFVPTRIEIFHIGDENAFNHALQTRALKQYKQGRQSSGEKRKPKYKLNFSTARESLLLTSVTLDHVAPIGTKNGPTLCRLEYLTTNGWAVGHAGIALLHPARYVERLTARGKFARCTELNPDLSEGRVHVSPNLPADFSILVPDPPYRIPRVGKTRPA